YFGISRFGNFPSAISRYRGRGIAGFLPAPGRIGERDNPFSAPSAAVWGHGDGTSTTLPRAGLPGRGDAPRLVRGARGTGRGGTASGARRPTSLGGTAWLRCALASGA